MKYMLEVKPGYLGVHTPTLKLANLSFLMVKRACQPSVNQGLRLKKTYFCGVRE